ncbi:MAG: hypothetical protein R2867_06285 [Caldilineaceae bacterium]
MQQRAYPAGDGNISAGLGWPVQLFVVNTNGTLLLEGRLINGKAHFEINATVTQVAGAMSLVAQVADRRATGVIHIEPGDPVEPVLVLVGPRSIPADGDHWTMLTALPQDQFGNAVAAGTAVTVRVLHPATTLSNGAAENGGPEVDTVEMISTTTDSLLASVRIYSRTKAGRMDMAAGAGDAHSPERTVMAVPGPPVPLRWLRSRCNSWLTAAALLPWRRKRWSMSTGISCSMAQL